MTTIALVGAGHIGSTVARAALRHGWDAVLSTASAPDTLTEVVRQLGPGARASTMLGAVPEADLALVAIPFAHYPSLDPEVFAGKLVIDANNYFPQRDGAVDAIDSGSTTSSEMVAAHLNRSTVVKAFNSIDAAELITTAADRGTAGRRAMALAGDDPGAKRTVASFINTIGFDPVDLGALSEGWRFGPGSNIFVQHLTADQVRERAGAATR